MKVFLTLFITAVCWVTYWLTNISYSITRAANMATQLEDSNMKFLAFNTVPTALVLVILGVWLLGLYSVWRKEIKLNFKLLAFLPILVLAGCGEPFETPDVQTVGANETAFLIPYDGSTNSQVKLVSEDYLNKNKVAAKQVVIPTKLLQTGYGPFRTWKGQLLPTGILIKVDRTPAVRAWTKQPDKGTSAHDEAITVESVEGIGFRLGVNASASITEDNAAKFLYFFAGAKLTDVMDQQVREYVQNQLFLDFSTRSLQDGINNKKEIFGLAEASTKTFFETRGITIDYIGGADQFTYVNTAIQQSIDAVFQAQKLKDANDEKLKAQAVQNSIDNGVAEAKKTQAISAATGASEATKLQADADAHALQVKGDQLKSHPEIIQYQSVGNGWNGQGPSTLIQGQGGNSTNVPVVVPVPSVSK